MSDIFGDYSLFGTSKKKRKPRKSISKKNEVKKDTRRSFNRTQQKQILYQQDNKCARCHEKLDPRSTQFHHSKPWASGGRTKIENGRALCGTCHDIAGHEHRLKNTDETKKPTTIKTKTKKTKKPKSQDVFGFGEFKPPKIKLF